MSPTLFSGLALGASILYGVLHDQVTARVCVEDFTIGHPRVIASESPTLLALYGGVAATWWAGLSAGLLLALCARAGRRPPLAARRLRRPLALQLACMACAAPAAGIAGHAAARSGEVWRLPPLADRIRPGRHAPYIADLWAHVTSYAAGALGTLALGLHTWRRRG